MIYYSMGKASRKKHEEDHATVTAEDKSRRSPDVRPQTSRTLSKAGRGIFFKPAVHVLIIAILGILAYSNTFHSPFQWDEADYIVENPIVRNLEFFKKPSLAEGLPIYDGLKSRYIGYLTFALNYKLHGFNVFGYHFVNLAIHLINAILVYFLVLLTFRTPYFTAVNSEKSAVNSKQTAGGPEIVVGSPVSANSYSLFTTHYSRLFALAVALLFVAHPVQTEAVTYIFQRFASLVTMLYPLSMVFYIKARERQGKGQAKAKVQVEIKEDAKTQQPDSVSVFSSTSALTLTFYVLSLFFAICAMKTKENALTLPIVITLYEFLFFTGSLRRRLLRLVPWLLTMMVIFATFVRLNRTAGEIISQIKDPSSFGYEKLSGSIYLLTQFRVIVTYIRLIFLPVNQNLGYDYPIYRSFFNPPVILSFIFLAALFMAAIYLIYKSRPKVGSWRSGDRSLSLLPQTSILYRLIGFGILWFFITLSVESSIIPIPMVIDEYRIYLPSVGFFLALIAAVVAFLSRTSRFSLDSGLTKAATAVLVLVTLALASATYARNSLWKDKVILWEDVVSKSPGLPSARINLGLAYNDAGIAEQAIEQYKIALQLLPNSSLAHMNMGNALDTEGRLDEALIEYETALRLAPDNWLMHLNLGNAYGKKGLTDKAIEELRAALALNPYSAAVFNNLGNAYSQKGEIDKAIDHYLDALRLEPGYAEAHFNLASTYEEKGENDKAIDHYLSALNLKPDNVEAHYNLGRVYVRLKRTDDAIEQLASAVKLSPDSADYRNTLGVLYAQKGLYDKAIEQFESALSLFPDNPAFRRNLERAQNLKYESKPR